MHTRTQTRTLVHTYFIHTKHAHTFTYTHGHIHTHTHIHMGHTCIQTHAWMYTLVIQTYTCILYTIHTYIDACIGIHMHTTGIIIVHNRNVQVFNA